MSVTQRAAQETVTPATASARRAPLESSARGGCQEDVLDTAWHSLPSAVASLAVHQVLEWFGLERMLEFISFHPLP